MLSSLAVFWLKFLFLFIYLFFLPSEVIVRSASWLAVGHTASEFVIDPFLKIIYLLLEIGSCCVVQASLELLGSGDPPASAS